MSPRAAARLERLGFGEVYDYVGSKMDWMGAGLPWEGALADGPTLGSLADPKVATCGLDDTVGAVRAPAGGPPFCLVIDERRVVLGLVRAEALDLDAARPVVEVMQEGPSTYRPHVPAAEAAERLKRHPQAYFVVTTLDGRLVGVTDAATVRAAAPPPTGRG